MMAPHAPVEARTAQWPSLPCERIDVDAELAAEALAVRCQFERCAAGAQPAPSVETVEHQHTEIACEMVVTDPRLAQSGLARARANPHGAGAVRDTHQAFQEIRDVAIGEPEVAVPPLVLDGKQLRVDQLREMRAHRLLGDAGEAGELGRSQRFAPHQRGEDLGARVIADQRSDADDARPVFHGSILVEP